jgi:hypothetical protein
MRNQIIRVAIGQHYRFVVKGGHEIDPPSIVLAMTVFMRCQNLSGGAMTRYRAIG